MSQHSRQGAELGLRWLGGFRHSRSVEERSRAQDSGAAQSTLAPSDHHLRPPGRKATGGKGPAPLQRDSEPLEGTARRCQQGNGTSRAGELPRWVSAQQQVTKQGSGQAGGAHTGTALSLSSKGQCPVTSGGLSSCQPSVRPRCPGPSRTLAQTGLENALEPPSPLVPPAGAGTLPSHAHLPPRPLPGVTAARGTGTAPGRRRGGELRDTEAQFLHRPETRKVGLRRGSSWGTNAGRDTGAPQNSPEWGVARWARVGQLQEAGLLTNRPGSVSARSQEPVSLCGLAGGRKAPDGEERGRPPGRRLPSPSTGSEEAVLTSVPHLNHPRGEAQVPPPPASRGPRTGGLEGPARPGDVPWLPRNQAKFKDVNFR